MMYLRSLLAAGAMAVCAVPAQTAAVELTVNGGFETGGFTGWTLYPSAPGTIAVASPGVGSTFAGCLNNTVLATASLIKNANVGVGTVQPGEVIAISFDVRGATATGGVAIAEMFSELSGGGTSKSVILGGGPLALDPDPNKWKRFSFTTTAGTDVSGGVTLQLAAITGGAPGSVSNICFDNASVAVARPTVPATYTPLGAGCPGTVGTPGLAALALPWVGATFQVALQNLPSNAPASLLLGVSNSRWGGLTLPLDLGLIGMTGCTLFSSGEVVLATTAIGGSATFSIPLTQPRLIGGVFYSQGVALDLAANPGGVVVSNAARGVFGLR